MSESGERVRAREGGKASSDEATVREFLMEPESWHGPRTARTLDAFDRLMARVVVAEREREFWKDRYDVQHGTVHRLEDALAVAERERDRLRDALDTVDWLLHIDRKNPDPVRAAVLTRGEAVKGAVVEIVRAALDAFTSPEGSPELARSRAREAELTAIGVELVADHGVESDDARLDYIVLQVTRAVWLDFCAVLAARSDESEQDLGGGRAASEGVKDGESA